MAYSSRSSRGGSRGARSGGGGGAGPLILAVLLVAGVIGGIVVFATNKKDPPAAAPTAPPPSTVPVAPQPGTPKPPPPPPYPPLDASRVLSIKKEIGEMEPLAKKGQALHDEAKALKDAGKDAEWQKKLREAVEPLEEIQDRWNEIIASLPSTKDYDEEDVANHYIGTEAEKVRKWLAPLMGLKKQMRLGGS
jgi:hypothetical protein